MHRWAVPADTSEPAHRTQATAIVTSGGCTSLAHRVAQQLNGLSTQSCIWKRRSISGLMKLAPSSRIGGGAAHLATWALSCVTCPLVVPSRRGCWHWIALLCPAGVPHGYPPVTLADDRQAGGALRIPPLLNRTESEVRSAHFPTWDDGWLLPTTGDGVRLQLQFEQRVGVLDRRRGMLHTIGVPERYCFATARVIPEGWISISSAAS